MTIRSKKKRQTSTETTGQPASQKTTDVLEARGIDVGERGEIALDQPRLRGKLRDLAEYMRAGVFSEEECDLMLRKMGSIVAKGSDRSAIAAFKVILARAKLDHDIDRGPIQHQHGHIHVGAEQLGVDLAQAASELGIEIAIRSDDAIEAGSDEPMGRTESEDE